MDASIDHAVVFTAEYGSDMQGGLGTYTNMLVSYLETRADQVHVVLSQYDNVDTVTQHRDDQGRSIVEMPYPVHVREPSLEGFEWYEAHLNAVTGQLPLHASPLLIGNDWFGGYLAEQFVQKTYQFVSSAPTFVFVPHLFRSQVMLNGYEGPDFDALIEEEDTAAEGLARLGNYSHQRRLHELEVRLIERADATLFISDYMKRYAETMMGATPQAAGVVEHFVASASHVKSSYRDAVRDVAFVGRFSFQKGLADVLEHLDAILDVMPDATLHFYGGGEMEPLVRWRTRSYDRVVLHDFVPRDDLMRRLPDLDLLVMPSIFEPFGYSALEAMAASVPLAASRQGGLATLTDWLPDALAFQPEMGTNPLYYSPSGVGGTIAKDELTRVLEYAATHPDRLREVARTGKAVADRRYSRERYVDQMDAFLGGTVAHPSSA